MANSVVDQLRSDIIGSVFMPGERLVELDLCDRDPWPRWRQSVLLWFNWNRRA